MTPTPFSTEPAPPPPVQVRARLPLQPVRATYVLLVLIGLVFAAQLAGFDTVIQQYGEKENFLIAHGELWRLLTAVFIHVNLLHVLFNAYALYNLGREVEMFYGSLRFSLVFFFAGLAGSVTSMLLTPSPSVGASGAIFGLIGAEGVFLYRNRRLLGERGRRGLQNIIFIIVLNFAIGLQAQFIDSGAHLGGLIGGALLGWLIGPVWGFPAEPTLGGEVMLGYQHPLTGARWLAAAAAAASLATLTGIAIAFPR